MPAHILCNSNDIPEGASRGFTLIDNTTLFVVKKDGEFFVYINSCPHLGIELEWIEDQFLDSEAALIQCSTHGALFTIENGACISGPCLGKSLTAIPFTIEHNHLVIDYP